MQSRNNKRVDEDQSNIQISTDLEGSISNEIVSSSCQTELSIGELENSSNKFQKVIKRPSNLLARAQVWSNYKHHSTIKFMIGITPQGTISYVSQCAGGRMSDKEIVENSTLVNFLLPGKKYGSTISDCLHIMFLIQVM